MIYSNRKYPFDLFNAFHPLEASLLRGNHLVIYTKNKSVHIGRLMTHSNNGSCIVQTMWNISETIEHIPMNSITHVSILSYL